MSEELHHLFNAIQQDRLEQVTEIIKNHSALVNAKDEKGLTSLTIAAAHGNTGIVNTLIKHGAHINYQIPGKLLTPLMIAIQNMHIDTIKYLLKNGADKNITDVQGNTALWYASEKNNSRLLIL